MKYLLFLLVLIPQVSFAALTPDAIIKLTNQERKAQKLQALKVNKKLQLAAQRKAVDMAARQYFAHQTPEGKRSWDFMKDTGYQYCFAGENLAINFTKSEDVVSAWMKSESHKKNILNGYKEIGVAIVPGYYQKIKAFYVVQMFGAANC